MAISCIWVAGGAPVLRLGRDVVGRGDNRPRHYGAPPAYKNVRACYKRERWRLSPPDGKSFLQSASPARRVRLQGVS